MRPRIYKSLVVLLTSISLFLMVSAHAKSSEDINRNSIENSDESEQSNQFEVVRIPSKIYRCGTLMADGKICGGLVAKSRTTYIEASKNLFGSTEELPTLFERPEKRQMIFLNGVWGVVAHRRSDMIISTDGQVEIDVYVPDVGISTLNWEPPADITLAYNLVVDKTVVFESEYRNRRKDSPPYLRWTEVSEEVVDALDNGTKLQVALVDEAKRVVHEDLYQLEGFSENLVAIRKLLSDSPRVSQED